MAFTVHRILTIGFVVIVGLVLVGVLVSLVAGQDHPFPFKTLEEITSGLPAWPLDGLPVIGTCPSNEATIVNYQYMSAAKSGWAIYTDGKMFLAAYFPPVATETQPITVVIGHIRDDKVVIETMAPYGTQHACDPWSQKPT